ncbi:hypothetical protein GTY20_30165 [Streptomyces sp. SID4946]|uniref:WXG100 family type VII secretion target n=1 Tax=Streptomyces TaxID=1883 RepID=UPI00081EFCE9|nr:MULTISPECIES: hypothetical protein [unclassified Streptomyces]MYQ95236.1 hypothetical protein [Streptomyces sp. SID4946]MYR87222.1 hypothetical protein [Streptomyces sp. SID685]SCF63781.1 Proteins of 100 residues with WXG [Streptomyces sp. LamerLS-31b]SCF94430.1 Proteins of 100 residues with WXG [Streptomyces sp. DconLS]
MSAGTQKITADSVVKLEQKLNTQFEGIKSNVTTLQQLLDSLEGHWKGIGAGAFNAKQVELNESLVRIGNILVKFMDAMNTTMKINDGTEDQVRASVQRIDVQAGAAHSALSSY